MTKANRKDGDYEVGYGRPPKSSRFKPGRSGNPKGRAKGAQSITASLKRELETKVIVREGDRQVKMTKAEAVARRVMNKALTGDLTAIKLLAAIDGPLAKSARTQSEEPETAPGPSQADRDILKWFATMAVEWSASDEREGEA